MIIELSRINLWTWSAPAPDYDTDFDYKDFGKTKTPVTTDVHTPHKPQLRGKGAEAMEAEEYFKNKELREAQEVKDHYRPCDKRVDLYVVNETFIRGEHSFSSVDKDALPENGKNTDDVR